MTAINIINKRFNGYHNKLIKKDQTSLKMTKNGLFLFLL